jgi:hypothetical protein
MPFCPQTCLGRVHDVALSRDSRLPYGLEERNGGITGLSVGSDESLSFIRPLSGIAAGVQAIPAY